MEGTPRLLNTMRTVIKIVILAAVAILCGIFVVRLFLDGIGV